MLGLASGQVSLYARGIVCKALREVFEHLRRHPSSVCRGVERRNCRLKLAQAQCAGHSQPSIFLYFSETGGDLHGKAGNAFINALLARLELFQRP
ncbi:hypothetical protein D3C84_1046530 [compost metagenome]